MLVVAMNPASGSTIGRATTIAVLHVDSAQAKRWSREGPREKRAVAITGSITKVLKGAAQPATGVHFSIEQWRNTGARITAPVGPWSAHEIDSAKEFVVFSTSREADWETVLAHVTLACVANECLAQVRAALPIDWESLPRIPADSAQWGPLFAEALIEQGMPFVRQPSRWASVAAVIERGDLPAVFRTKATQELFASLSLAGPIPLEPARMIMRLFSHLLASGNVSADLKRNLLTVYYPNLLRAVENYPQPTAQDLLPDPNDRAGLARSVSSMPATPESARVLAWLER
jgi:hypothetical protein